MSMSPSSLKPRLQLAATLVLFASVSTSSPAVTYILDDFTGDTVSLEALGATVNDTRQPTNTDSALSYTIGGEMELTLTASQGPQLLRSATIANGTFTYTNLRNPNDSWTLAYGSAVNDTTQFIIPSDAGAVGFTDLITSGQEVIYTMRFFDVDGILLGIPISKVVAPDITIDLLLFEITAGVDALDIPNIRGMSLVIDNPNASEISAGSFTSVILIPEPSRAFLLAISLSLFMLRRSR